jgi:RNA polymerase sigma factor (sigma-70 family)
MIAGVLLRTQPDDRLAVLAGEGSKPAFEEIVRRHQGALVGFAAKIAPSARADDVVQESMVKAYLALQRGDRPDSPKAWLFRIVRNTALNERRDWREFDHLDENYDGVEQPPQAAERRGELRSLVKALGALPESQRTAIVQRELEGRGHDEIAASLGTSPGAVRQLIFRARETLRTGMGALIPIQVLRMALVSGSAEPVVAGATGAGIGLTAAKVGIGAVLATGVVAAGVHVEDSGKNGKEADQVVATGPEAAEAASQPTTATGTAGDGGTTGGSFQTVSRKQTGIKKADADPVPRQTPPPRPGDANHRPGAGNPPPPNGAGSQNTQTGGGQTGDGQHRGGDAQPPPPPPPPTGYGTKPAP